VEYPGAIYHVMSRGDRREEIFLDEVDRQDFLKTLAEACQKTGWQVPAYCLMRNHFHLVVETPNANLIAGMRWLLSAYTIGLNHRHQLSGHVFSGRYKAFVREELRRSGWREADLVAGRKSDPGKLAIAARLRRETALTIKGISARVGLGSSKSAHARLHQWMRNEGVGANPGRAQRRHPK
jgi:REP element-mobilizing transposase RayT